MSMSYRVVRCLRLKVIQDKTSCRLAGTLVISRNKDTACPQFLMKLAKPTVIPYRTLFGLPKLPNPLPQLAGKKIEYSEKHILGYSMEQMFEVVSDVESYQEFVPWCTSSKVHSRSDTRISAELVIGFPPVTESYTSDISLRHPHYIKAECKDGKLFNYMVTAWRFSPGLADNAQTCTLDLSVSFEFISALHSQLARVFFDEVARKTANAFVKRAEVCYGKGSIKSRPVVQYS